MVKPWSFRAWTPPPRVRRRPRCPAAPRMRNHHRLHRDHPRDLTTFHADRREQADSRIRSVIDRASVLMMPQTRDDYCEAEHEYEMRMESSNLRRAPRMIVQFDTSTSGLPSGSSAPGRTHCPRWPPGPARRRPGPAPDSRSRRQSLTGEVQPQHRVFLKTPVTVTVRVAPDHPTRSCCRRAARVGRRLIVQMACPVPSCYTEPPDSLQPEILTAAATSSTPVRTPAGRSFRPST